MSNWAGLIVAAGALIFLLTLGALVLRDFIRVRNARSVLERPRTWLNVGPPLLGCAGILPIVLSFGYWNGLGLLEFALRALGLATFLGGAALAQWGYFSLGAQLALDIEIKKGHQLINSGAYRLVRHPVYAGITAMYLGAGLGLANWALLLWAAPVAWAFLERACAEERLLVKYFGSQYADYQKRVPMLVPLRFTRNYAARSERS